MFFHGWQVFTFPKVRVTSDQLIQAAPKFEPWGTSEELGASACDVPRGSTVWGCNIRGAAVGIAWEWVAVRPRVVAMGDPMTLHANLDLVSGEGVPLADGARLLKLHELIFALPWQSYVREARWPVELRLAA